MIKYTTPIVIDIYDMEKFLSEKYGDDRRDVWTTFAAGHSNDSYDFINEEALDDILDYLVANAEDTDEDEYYKRKIKIIKHLKEAMKENEVPKNFLITIWW